MSQRRRVGDEDVAITSRQLYLASWAVYLLVDVVVLNLLVEYVSSVTIDSFAISIATAVALRLMLAATVGVEHWIATTVARRGDRRARVIGRTAMFLVLFLSKFVILEVVDLVFGSHAELGGVVEIIAISLLLLGAEWVCRAAFRALGGGGGGAARALPR